MSVSCGPNSSDIFTFSGMLVLPIRSKSSGYLAAGRQRATLRCDGLDLRPKRNLVIQKRVSGGPVFGAFVGILDMFHGYPLRRFRNLFETKPTPETAARTPIFFAPM